MQARASLPEPAISGWPANSKMQSLASEREGMDTVPCHVAGSQDQGPRRPGMEAVQGLSCKKQT